MLHVTSSTIVNSERPPIASCDVDKTETNKQVKEGLLFEKKAENPMLQLQNVTRNKNFNEDFSNLTFIYLF